jgi:hypothetical protein
VDPKDLDRFFEVQGSKQIFLPPPLYRGHIAATHLDDRWTADIIVLTQRPSEYRGRPIDYVLVCQDVSRVSCGRSRCRPSRRRPRPSRESSRTARPTSCSRTRTWSSRPSRFEDLLADHGIRHAFKRSRNDLATVDRAISTR